MSRGLLFASLLYAGTLTPGALGAGPPCSELRTVTYPVADLVIPPDTRPVTVTVGQQVQAHRPLPRKKIRTTETRLIDQITREVAPGTWTGRGKIEYHAKGMSLVVAHTSAAHKKVATLLSDLRRKQDVNVSVELRVVRVSEQTFERIGVDFEPKKGEFFDRNGLRSVLEVAQGDRRTNVMQAPKITCLEGQRINFRIADNGTNFALSMTATPSADRRFVRLNLRLQRDGVENEKVKVVLADGCSIALPGWSASRTVTPEFGPPFLNRIPYLNRLFKHEMSACEPERVFLLVTPRVIVQEEVVE